jgi:hypothetical protein
MAPPDEGQGGGQREEGAQESGLPAPDQVDARVTALIDRGLELYGRGELVGALSEWEHALTLDPDSARAKEYLQYVRENFELLDEQFREAREAASRAAAEGVPMPEIPEDLDAYDELEVELTREPTPPVVEPGKTVTRPRLPARPTAPPPTEEIDEGWELDDWAAAAPLPPPPASAAPEDSETLELTADFAPAGAAGDDGAAEAHAALGGGAGPADRASTEREDPGAYAAGLGLGGDDGQEVTVPGGEEPPPLPDRPALAVEAIAALAGRAAPVTIMPRRGGDATGTNPGTGPATGTGTSPGTTPGLLPGELPAPPLMATPQGLEIELNALDPSVGDDRAADDVELGPAAELPPGPGIGEPVGAAELGLGGDDTGELTRPAAKRAALSMLPDDLPTIERAPTTALDDLDLEGDFDAGQKTGERTSERRTEGRSPFAGDAVTGAAESRRDSTHTPLPGGPAVIVDEQLLKAYDEVAEDDSEPTAAREPAPADAPPSPEDRLRRRVTELLQRAREAAERGQHLAAVEAAEEASTADPEGKVAPVILHRHRDLLYRVYEGHIGEMSQVPLLAVPLHQIAAERLDHRTGFLLSRIDGMLSFEDILDVSGMPRLDAYRILSNLLRRGFIEVR